MAGDSDLIVNVKVLVESESLLGGIQKELKGISNRRDQMHPHWGSIEISEAMGEFVDNWDDYRAKMIEGVTDVGKLVTNTINGFTDTDLALAKELRRQRKGK